MTDSHNEKICNGNEISTHGIVNEQLFSPRLFRLWRTGADELATLMLFNLILKSWKYNKLFRYQD